MHLGVLEEITGGDASAKIGIGQELIIFTFNFSGARRAGCARHRIDKVRCLAKRFDERGLTGAGWRGDDEENAVTGELLTQGFEFAREFFPIRPCRQRPAAKCLRRSPLPRGC